MKKRVALVIFIVLLIGSLYGLYKYIVFNKTYSSSNAVFVKSDTLTFLSFKLPGKIEKIYVNEGDDIKKGELLAKLDTKSLEIQKKELEFNIKALHSKINAIKLQKEKISNDIKNELNLTKNDIFKLQKKIESFTHVINAMKYKLNKLKNDYLRFSKLYRQGKISREKFEGVKTAYFALKEEIKAKEKSLEALKTDKKSLGIKLAMIENSKKEVLRLEKLIKSSKNQLKALKEKLSLVNQQIRDSYLYSPIDGKVAKKLANNDEVVNAGMRVLSVVNPRDVYVLDLLEETKLKGIKPGCEAKIHIDALDEDFDGVVEKILPASAATFALVPRDISSGEFTKLAQRFYVRIRFKKVPKNVLVGMSGEVQIAKCDFNK
jgi:membrane fusion protein (multidrug efflux system)